MAKKSSKAQSEKLFEETFVRGAVGSGKLFDVNYEYQEQLPVECLGMQFPNDEVRKVYFRERLREKLNEPNFRNLEGFPSGEDDDILALSDPPYYTACPNPWLEDFLVQYEVSPNESQPYSREPFATDISEGKNDPIYNAHSYHTKVPHKAIMRYILHYTKPGDVVFDGFCGTGMTGVAALMCGDREQVESLGYKVMKDGSIAHQVTNIHGETVWTPFSKLGTRRALLNDLSPAATFITYNYNTPPNKDSVERAAEDLLTQIEDELGWMYETLHHDGKTKGRINYVIWSDVFTCPVCEAEIVYWDHAVQIADEKVKDEFFCPGCNSVLSKPILARTWSTRFDVILNKTCKVAKQVPVLIDYSIEGSKVRYKKKPDKNDYALIETVENHSLLKSVPSLPIPIADKTSEPLKLGITHTHLFYSARNLLAINAILSCKNRLAVWKAHATALINSKMNRWPRQRGPLSLTLFVGSICYENNVFKTVANRQFPTIPTSSTNITTTQSATTLSIAPETVDYIFIDPPFGSNIYYSDLNIVWEAWLKVRTANKFEAIESRSQAKTADDYRELMRRSFDQAYRILKPGRWITIEFSNTKASIWNCIQTALAESGFIVANVSALSKKQGSFNAVSNTTSVTQDLVISAYKPNAGFEQRFKGIANCEEGVWEFDRSHLQFIPVVKTQGKNLMFVSEREPRILFDQMVSYYVRNGLSVPISSLEFQSGLAQHFMERDGMYFLPPQATEYDRIRLESKEVVQYDLFVSDEKSAIQWVRSQLARSPMSYQEISPLFLQEAQRVWEKHEQPVELSVILQQNFFQSPNGDWHIPDPKNEVHLEQIRNRALMKEFQVYLETKGKLKVVRTEALRAGFKECWNSKDYLTIIQIAKRIPEAVILEDPALLMYYDNASVLLGE